MYTSTPRKSSENAAPLGIVMCSMFGAAVVVRTCQTLAVGAWALIMSSQLLDESCTWEAERERGDGGRQHSERLGSEIEP